MSKENATTTFNLSSFTTLDAPTYGKLHLLCCYAPQIDGMFTETFYALLDGKISAFKILAWAIMEDNRCACLIQTPIKREWVVLREIPFFRSIKNLIKGEEKVSWRDTSFRYYTFDGKGSMYVNGDYATTVEQSYYYDETYGTAKKTRTPIKYIVGTPQGVFLGLEQKEKHYATEDECLSAKFNNIEIIDFTEPTNFEVKLEIPSVNVVTRKLVLK